MANNNSVVPYNKATGKEQQIAGGIAQFSPTDPNAWGITENGFIKNGGIARVSSIDGEVQVNFLIPANKQVLGIFTQAIYPSANIGGNEQSGVIKANSVTFGGFILINDANVKEYYWHSIAI